MVSSQRNLSSLHTVAFGLSALLIVGSPTAQTTYLEKPLHHAEGQQDVIVRFVHHHEFPAEVREKMKAFNKDFVRPPSLRLTGQASCPKTQRFVQGILDRLISGSNLAPAIIRGDYPVTMVVTCAIADHPDAEMKAGVLELSAALILLLQSEDEIAAVLAHEVAHFTLAHEHKVLENWHRLTPFAINRLRMWHEEEADVESLVLLSNAGYDPSAAMDALKVLRDYMYGAQLQSDKEHPQINSRIEALSKQINRTSFPKVPRRNEGLEAFKNEIKLRPQTSLGTRKD